MWCCYIMVDFATAAFQNGVCISITHQMCLTIILFHDCSKIKDQNFLNIIGFLVKEKFSVLNSFCDAAVAKSTVM
jgi:hypothetical protein